MSHPRPPPPRSVSHAQSGVGSSGRGRGVFSATRVLPRDSWHPAARNPAAADGRVPSRGLSVPWTLGPWVQSPSVLRGCLPRVSAALSRDTIDVGLCERPTRSVTRSVTAAGPPGAAGLCPGTRRPSFATRPRVLHVWDFRFFTFHTDTAANSVGLRLRHRTQPDALEVRPRCHKWLACPQCKEGTAISLTCRNVESPSLAQYQSRTGTGTSPASPSRRSLGDSLPPSSLKPTFRRELTHAARQCRVCDSHRTFVDPPA